MGRPPGAAEQLLRRGLASFASGDFELGCALYAPDAEQRDMGFGSVKIGPAGRMAVYQGWRDAMPDAVSTITDVVVSDDRYFVYEGLFTGTHTGVLHGILDRPLQPTGRSVRIEFAVVVEAQDGLIVRSTMYQDTRQWFDQLAVAPG